MSEVTDLNQNDTTVENVGVNPEPIDGVEDVYGETKIATIILLGDGQLNTEVRQEFFEGESEDAVRDALENLIGLAAESTLNEAKEFSENEEFLNYNTPINMGSLYDEIVFETGIYINTNNQVVTNTSFGKFCDPRVLLHENLAHVGETLQHVSEHFKEDSVSQNPSNVNNTNGGNSLLNRRSIHDDIKE